jgi:hypothetical protein
MFIFMLPGGRVYTGNDIRGTHALARDHGVNDAHFDVFLEHFRAALEEVGSSRKTPRKLGNLWKASEGLCWTHEIALRTRNRPSAASP